MSELKPILLCADDFAQSRAISAGILALARAGHVSAVSCFTDSPLWPELGRELTDARKDLLIGLHFNLTFPFGFGERPLWHWMIRSIAPSASSFSSRALASVHSAPSVSRSDTRLCSARRASV